MEPLYRYVRDISGAVHAKALYSALALALTVPDICGAIEYPDEQASNRRYRDWFNTWCGLHHSVMSAADCWALRCTYLHLARETFEGDAATWANLGHIQFTRGKVGGGWFSRFIQHSKPNSKPGVQIPVETFCRDMGWAALGWYQARKADPRVVAELGRLLEIRPAS